MSQGKEFTRGIKWSQVKNWGKVSERYLLRFSINRYTTWLLESNKTITQVCSTQWVTGASEDILQEKFPSSISVPLYYKQMSFSAWGTIPFRKHPHSPSQHSCVLVLELEMGHEHTTQVL